MEGRQASERHLALKTLPGKGIWGEGKGVFSLGEVSIAPLHEQFSLP